ncbi:NAD(P)-dependent oxidoreductase [Mesobacillus subterraneus]|uniref:6-phosphogluconate dehydrogenase n=1 Tax=Mesobacillus subterraneus TaxID=285983 RepID=A0A0D6Z4J9_9BACI|nr:NAD(P)-dependent oxidoreductase [Mesobacillus subterraneus]KIY20502.1 6-phosphogluconate dehydrogenase [Mesobacillus subterraneus]
MEKTIGFVGLGNMGAPMVMSLLKAGYRVKVYNRTPEKAETVIAAGADRVEHLADVAVPGGIVITMVSNDQALEEVTIGEKGFGHKLEEGSIHLSMSTVSPETSRKLAAFHGKHNSHYVASPVFGRPDAAAAQKLFILSSGSSKAKERTKPVQEAMGQRVFDLGEDPGNANVIKLGGNFMIMAAMEAMAESFNLAEKNGIDRQVAAEVYASTLFNCTVYNGYGSMIANRRFEPAGFQLELGLKDCNLVLEEANAKQTPMPFASILHDTLLASVAKGRGKQDWSALTRIASENAGLE